MRVVKYGEELVLSFHKSSSGEPQRSAGESGAERRGGFRAIRLIGPWTTATGFLLKSFLFCRAGFHSGALLECPRTSSYSSRLGNESPQMFFSTGSRRGHAPHLTAGHLDRVQLQRRAAGHPAAKSLLSGSSSNRVGGLVSHQSELGQGTAAGAPAPQVHGQLPGQRHHRFLAERRAGGHAFDKFGAGVPEGLVT